MLAWSSSWGASMITTSSAWAISGTRWCRLREGRATIRNGNAVLGGSLGSMAARSDHSRALPEGSASTRSTRFPAWAKMCASQTAEVVLPVPGLRLSRATLSAVINAVLQYLRRYGSPFRRYWHTARWAESPSIAPAAARGTAGPRVARITCRRWAGSLVRREQHRQVVDVLYRRQHRVPGRRSGITGARYLGRDEPGHHRGRERRAFPPGHPGKVLLRRPLRRLVVGVLAGGVGVDQPFAGRVDVHPAAEVAEPRLVLPVGSDRADADHPVEGRREELPVRVVIAGRRDQGELLMPFVEEMEAERGPVLTGVGPGRKVDHVRCVVRDELFQLVDHHVLPFRAGQREVIVEIHARPRRHAPGDTRHEGPVPAVLPDHPPAAGQGPHLLIVLPVHAVHPAVGRVRRLGQSGVADPDPHLLPGLARRARRRARLRRALARHRWLRRRAEPLDGQDGDRRDPPHATIGHDQVLVTDAIADAV